MRRTSLLELLRWCFAYSSAGRIRLVLEKMVGGRLLLFHCALLDKHLRLESDKSMVFGVVDCLSK